MIQLYFIRHGETDANKAYTQGGSFNETGSGTNISLNEIGKLQAQALSLTISPDVVFSSPLIRVKETAEIFCSNHGLKCPDIIYDDRLIEYSKGKFEGVEFAEISKQMGLDVKDTCLSCTYDFSQYGGDSAETIKAHVISFLEMIKNKYQDKTVLCFSSAGVIRMMYFVLMEEKNPGIAKSLRVKNTSIHHFTL